MTKTERQKDETERDKGRHGGRTRGGETGGRDIRGDNKEETEGARQRRDTELAKVIGKERQKGNRGKTRGRQRERYRGETGRDEGQL